jgi:hypothetical protein
MNSEELRNLTESYYYDVYDNGDLDEGLSGKRIKIADYMLSRIQSDLDEPGQGTNPQLLKNKQQLQNIRGNLEGSTNPNPGPDELDFKGPRNRGGRGFRRGPKTVGQSGSLDRPATNRTSQSVLKSIRRHEKKHSQNESYDLYDVVLEHLLAEGYADDTRSAEVIMANMSDEWLGDILDEAYLNEISSDAAGLVDPHRGTTFRDVNNPRRVMTQTPVEKMEVKQGRLQGLRDLRNPKDSQLSPNNQRRLRNITTALRVAGDRERAGFARKVEGIKQATK